MMGNGLPVSWPPAVEWSTFLAWPASLLALPYTWRLTIVSLYTLASSVWAYEVVRPLPAGSRRFGAAVPIIAGHMFIPFLMSRENDLLTLLVLSFVLTWLSLFKVVGPVFGLSPSSLIAFFEHYRRNRLPMILQDVIELLALHLAHYILCMSRVKKWRALAISVDHGVFACLSPDASWHTGMFPLSGWFIT